MRDKGNNILPFVAHIFQLFILLGAIFASQPHL